MNHPIVNNIYLDMTDPNPDSQFLNNIEGVNNRSVQGNDNDSVQGNDNNFVKVEGIYINNLYCQSVGEKNELTSSQTPTSLSQEKVKNSRSKFVLAGDYNKIDEEWLRLAQDLLREYGIDTKLIIVKAEEGSIKITIEAESATLERLKTLFESGELTELLKFPIEDVRILNEERSNNRDNIVSVKNPSLQEIFKDRRSDLSEADLIKANQKVGTAVATNTILEQLKTLSLLEAAELIKQIEEFFGVSAAAPVAGAPAEAAEAAEAAEEKTEFDIILESVPDDKKISVLKVVRGLTGLGLKEAKDMIEAAPKAIREGVPKDAAEDAKKQIEEAGGKVSIK